LARDHRRLAAIVSIDVVGYSRLMGHDESGTLTAFKAHRRELIDLKIAEHEGRIVKTTGDGLLLEFPSVVDAVRCAVEIQRGMAERNTGIAADKRLDFRIGINVGDIIIDGDDIFGDGVNVAARVESLAEAGGICISRIVRDHVLDKLDFTFEDLGPHQVKNIARPVDVYRVYLNGQRAQGTSASRKIVRLTAYHRPQQWLAASLFMIGVVAVGAWWAWHSLTTRETLAPPLGSLAVLPLISLSGSVDGEQLAQRLTIDLTSALQRSMPRTSVISHSLASTYKGKTIDARQVGKSLNVRYLMEGDVLRAGTRTAVKARLIETSNATELWNDDVIVDEPADAQDRPALVARLTSEISAAVYRAESQRVLALPLSELSAAELAHRGDAIILRDFYSPAAWSEAQKLYDMALRLDPNQMDALMGKAGVLLGMLRLDLDPNADRKRLLAEYDKLTVRLVATAGREARAWAFRADALAHQWRWEAAIDAINKAQVLEPNRESTPVHRMYLLNYMGRWSEALELGDELLSRQGLGYESNIGVHHGRCSALLA
jgi:adenylate cyclase